MFQIHARLCHWYYVVGNSDLACFDLEHYDLESYDLAYYDLTIIYLNSG